MIRERKICFLEKELGEMVHWAQPKRKALLARHLHRGGVRNQLKLNDETHLIVRYGLFRQPFTQPMMQVYLFLKCLPLNAQQLSRLSTPSPNRSEGLSGRVRLGRQKGQDDGDHEDDSDRFANEMHVGVSLDI